MRRRILYATSVLAGLAGYAAQIAPASAQGLEEIVVTARKTEESLMEVPLSITAVSAANIEAANIKDVRDVAAYTPGLFIQYSQSGAAISRSMTFRGLGVSNGGQVFIDGAPYVGQSQPDMSALERIEVLLGPQSAYFGRSTFTGALNYITKAPSMTDFKGKLSAEYASFASTDTSLSLEGPLVADKVGIRVTARHTKMDGHWTNRSNPDSDVGSTGRDAVTASVLFQPSDALKFKMFLQYAVDDNGQSPAIQLSAYNFRNTPGGQYQSRQLNCNLGGTFGPWWCGGLPEASQLDSMGSPGTAAIISWYDTVNPTIYNYLFNDPNNIYPYKLFDPYWNTSFGTKQANQSFHLNGDYTTADGWVFNSTTALHYTKYQGIIAPNYRDSTGVPNTNPTRILPWVGFYNNFMGQFWDGSQELRITSPQDRPLRFTAGGNYLGTATPGNTNYGISPSGNTIAGTLTTLHTSTPAVFGGVYFDIMPQLTIGAEARYQWDKLSARTKWPLPPPSQRGNLTSTYKSFSPRVTIDWNFAEGGTLYALWSRGYRPGGFNTQVLGQPQVVLDLLSQSVGINFAFLQEKLDNYEVGFKNTWWDGRIQTAVGAYYDKWRNGQVTNTVTVLTPTGVQQISATQNVGAVDLKGLEFTGAIAVTDKFTVNANANFIHSEIRAYVYTPNGTRIRNSTNVNGNQFNGNPIGWTFAVTPSYTDHLVGDWDWYARADWKHRGRYFVDAVNAAWIPARDTFDLHLGIKNESFTIEAFVMNLTNDTKFETGEVGTDSGCCAIGAANTNSIRLLLPRQRQFGIKGSYSF